MAHKRSSDEDRARDVLAAEELGVPAIAPALHTEPPHDVLAAEEYGVPDREPAIHHGPVDLPGDPTGIAEPHDVLAAEEFAMPAPRPSGEAGALIRRSQPSLKTVALSGLGALLALRLLVRLLRR